MQVKKLKILVIEDKKENIEAAKKQLAGHDLTIADSFDEAYKILQPKDSYIDRNEDAVDPSEFDVVLTDVMMPRSSDGKHGICLSGKGQQLADEQGDMPYGPILVLHALQAGIKNIGILTSGDHHSDPVILAFDRLKGFKIGEVNFTSTNRMDVPCFADSFEQLNHGYDSERNFQFYRVEDTEVIMTKDEFWVKCKNGEIISVKNWSMLLDRLMSSKEAVEEIEED